MEKIINNVASMGFLNLVIWFIFILMLHFFVNSGFKSMEKYLGLEITLYWYDFVWLGIMIFTFVYGIYKYR